MPYRRFMPYDIIGSGLWAATFCLLGYIFSNNIAQVIDYTERGVLIFGWTVGTIVVVVYLVRRFRKPEERAKLSLWLDEQEKQPSRARVIRPLRKAWNKIAVPIAHTFAPQVRFAWQRFTPGGLGLEFTTAMAVLVTGGYTFYFFLVAALDWPTNEFTNRIDDAAFRLCDSIRTDWLDSIAKIVTDIGAFWFVAPFVLATVIYCLRRRQVPEAIVLTIGLLLTAGLVHATKSWTDVPRPTGSLVDSLGSSFPSGHTAYAVFFVAIAVALNRIGGILTRAAVVITAIVIAAVVGFTRIYLRAHYLSDVLGGAALALLVLSVLTGIAMLIVHVRKLRAAETAAAADTVT
jgi:undecaprenyl-diphosphatase